MSQIVLKHTILIQVKDAGVISDKPVFVTYFYQIYLLPVVVRLAHLILLVVEYNDTEVGSQVDAVAVKFHVVDSLRRGHNGILYIGDIVHLAVVVENIDIRVGIYHHQIVLIVVVIDICHIYIVQQVVLVVGLHLLGLLVEAEKRNARHVIDPVAGIYHLHGIAHRRVDLPATHSQLRPRQKRKRQYDETY